MKKLKTFIIYGLLPLLIIFLCFTYVHLYTDKYPDLFEGVFNYYEAEITSSVKVKKIRPGEKIRIPVTVKNNGSITWGKNSNIRLAYHLLVEEKYTILRNGIRTNLHSTVKPEEKIKLKAKVNAPGEAGIYYLEFDMVHEGRTWFADKDSPTLLIKLIVEKQK